MDADTGDRQHHDDAGEGRHAVREAERELPRRALRRRPHRDNFFQRCWDRRCDLCAQPTDQCRPIASDLTRIRGDDTVEINAGRQLVERVLFEREDFGRLNFGRARQLLVRKAELYTRFSQLIPYGHGARTLADSLPTSPAASSRLAGGSPSDTDGVTSSDSGLISPESRTPENRADAAIHTAYSRPAAFLLYPSRGSSQQNAL